MCASVNPIVEELSSNLSILKDASKLSVEDYDGESYSIFEKFDEVVEGHEYSCTDGSDDGKLSFVEASCCVVDGVVTNSVSKFKDFVSGTYKKVKENPVKSALIGLGTAAIMVSPLAPIALTALGGVGTAITAKNLFGSAKDVASSIENAKNATTDKEAKEAFNSIGSSSVDVVENTVGLYLSSKALLNAGSKAGTTLNTGNPIDDEIKMAQEISESLENVIDKAGVLNTDNETIVKLLNSGISPIDIINKLNAGSNILTA